MSRVIFRQVRKRAGSMSMLAVGRVSFGTWAGDVLADRTGLAMHRIFSWIGGLISGVGWERWFWRCASSGASHVDNHCWMRSVFRGIVAKEDKRHSAARLNYRSYLVRYDGSLQEGDRKRRHDRCHHMTRPCLRSWMVVCALWGDHRKMSNDLFSSLAIRRLLRDEDRSMREWT